MKYELRSWYEDRSCLYTDDPRVKDLAVLSPDLTVVSSYFKTTRAQQPFAWDIVRRVRRASAASFSVSRAMVCQPGQTRIGRGSVSAVQWVNSFKDP